MNKLPLFKENFPLISVTTKKVRYEKILLKLKRLRSATRYKASQYDVR